MLRNQILKLGMDTMIEDCGTIDQCNAFVFSKSTELSYVKNFGLYRVSTSLMDMVYCEKEYLYPIIGLYKMFENTKHTLSDIVRVEDSAINKGVLRHCRKICKQLGVEVPNNINRADKMIEYLKSERFVNPCTYFDKLKMAILSRYCFQRLIDTDIKVMCELKDIGFEYKIWDTVRVLRNWTKDTCTISFIGNIGKITDVKKFSDKYFVVVEIQKNKYNYKSTILLPIDKELPHFTFA